MLRTGAGDYAIAEVERHRVQNPLSSLAEDADAVTRAINHQSGPVVLVGQGYGGTVITQVGNHPRVAALLYVAAFAPDTGESTTDTEKDYPPSPCVAGFEIDAGGYIYLAHDAVQEFLAQDLPQRTTGSSLRAETHSHQRPPGSRNSGGVAYQAFLVRYRRGGPHDLSCAAAPDRED
jgi:pimeloyl-ACP methyl ester carboxylesterase